MKIGVIGTGAYGLAMVKALAKNKQNQIAMWTENMDKVKDYELSNKLPAILPDVELPKGIKFTNDVKEVIDDAEVVMIMVAAHFVSGLMPEIGKYVKKSQVICIGSKGIENNTCSFLSDIVSSNVKTHHVAVISGPSFAIDIASGEPIGLSIGSKSSKAIKTIKKMYDNTGIKLRATNDIIGVQLCGSIKNVFALAAGMLGGMGYSNSAQAFLITESIHDIKWLLGAVGGNPKTILSYAGVGDLLLTCTSVKSRNYSFGKLIGAGASKKEIEAYLKSTTVEGYYTLKSIYQLVHRRKIKMPIVDLINRIIMKNEDPNLLVEFLYNKK